MNRMRAPFYFAGQWVMPFQKGRNKTGGRVKGSRNKASREARERFRDFLKENITFTPLQIMHAIMLARIETGDLEGALSAAEADARQPSRSQRDQIDHPA